MVKPHHPRHLALLPGPAAEHADVITRLVSQVLDDHAHWRRNLHPEDPSLLPPSQRGGLDDVQADLEDHVSRLLAALKRSFPFHSPRYLAHMQSETTIPSLIGSLAGMLYNANNVTSESGAVTLELEVEACNRLLTMIGYRPPPTPPDRPTQQDITTYLSELDKGFGWCHLTSGGTSANTEALWAARNVRLNTLAIREALRIARGRIGPVDIEVAATGSNTGHSLAASLGDGGLSDKQLLGIPPAAAIGLLEAYYRELAGAPPTGDGSQTDDLHDWHQRQQQAKEWLNAGRKQLPRGGFRLRPVVLYPGTAHYSIKKAIDVLGLGVDCAVAVKTDGRHRMQIDDLRRRLEEIDSDESSFPLAVIGVAGTTEEGSVDPLHDIVEIRDARIDDGKAAFWLHADAAWGGYLRSMLTLSPRHRMHLEFKVFEEEARSGVSAMFGATTSSMTATGPLHGPAEWCNEFTKWFSTLDGNTPDIEPDGRAFQDAAGEHDWPAAYEAFRRLLNAAARHLGLGEPEIPAPHQVRQHLTGLFENRRYLSCDKVEMSVRLPYLGTPLQKTVEGSRQLPRPDENDSVLLALDALCKADSVTVDPHKLGYQHYACGAVAFQIGAVRDHVVQAAPYITSLGGRTVANQPLWRLETQPASPPVRKLEAPASYTLEGSRPSAPAVALWLSTTVLPLDIENHGAMVREGYLTAQELHTWLMHWNDFEVKIAPAVAQMRDPSARVQGPTFRFEALTRDGNGDPAYGDTNVVIFGVRPTSEQPVHLERYNATTNAVYEKFAILAERGEARHSYGQSFFLSKTDFTSEHYPADTIKALAEHIGVEFDDGVYEQNGLAVIRAAVMNPYIRSLRETRGVDVIGEFMVALAAAARDVTWPP